MSGQEIQYFYLPGDSYPQDDHIREALNDRLGLGVPALDRKALIPDRLSRLTRAMAGFPDAEFILFGRSSGCRVVTMAAADPVWAPRIRAVVALGYPFRQPKYPREPERVSHLVDVTSPCLILQGQRDQYGSDKVPQEVPFSDMITYRVIDADHNLTLSADAWDEVAAQISGFVGLQDRLAA